MRKNKKKKAKINFSSNMIITNNNPYTRVESYPAKEPHDSMLNLVLMPSSAVNGVSVNSPSPHPKIDCHLTSDLFTETNVERSNGLSNTCVCRYR